ncbi:unnamed protein product, partial [Didymodactylos carnosus]
MSCRHYHSSSDYDSLHHDRHYRDRFLRLPEDKPEGLNSKEEKNWDKATEKAWKNYKLSTELVQFKLPSTSYIIHYINTQTSKSYLWEMIHYVRDTQQFTIDDE